MIAVYSTTAFCPNNIRVAAGDGKTIQAGIRNAVHNHDMIGRAAPIGRTPVDNRLVAFPVPLRNLGLMTGEAAIQLQITGHGNGFHVPSAATQTWSPAEAAARPSVTVFLASAQDTPLPLADTLWSTWMVAASDAVAWKMKENTRKIRKIGMNLMSELLIWDDSFIFASLAGAMAVGRPGIRGQGLPGRPAAMAPVYI